MDSEKILNLDILDLCNILQAVGYTIKEVYKDSYEFDDKIGKSIQIKCNVSGVKVVLESKSSSCDCPEIEDNDDNGKWEMSGTSGGKQISRTENNSPFRKTMGRNVVTYIKDEISNILEMMHLQPSTISPPNKVPVNLSVSSSCLYNSPPRLALQIKADTPSRYRSLDTLNDAESNSVYLPEPRVLSASHKNLSAEYEEKNIESTQTTEAQTKPIKTIPRQNTYTASPTESSQEPRVVPSRTSSPVPIVPALISFNLYQAEKLTEELLSIIQESIKSTQKESDPEEKSLESLVMDVSKISSIKLPVFEMRGRSGSSASARSALPYASSPNLSRIQENSRIPQTCPKKKLYYKTSPTNIRPELKTHSLRNSIPKKIKSISPSFGIIGNKKSSGLSSVLGNPVLGSYKSLTEKNAIPTAGNLKSKSSSFKSSGSLNIKESEPKKRNSLYSHIKSTIPRHSIASKK